ncbi:MAG: hypothetical protein ACREBJ_06040, partial [Nitrosotalea sp.]
VEFFTYASVPPLPSSGGCTGNVLYWLGGDTTTSDAGKALTQPELQTDCADNKWRGYFEVASYSNPGTDLESTIFTNVVFSSGGSAVFDDAVYPPGNGLAGENCQFVGDNNDPNNEASHCFHGHTYGSSFSKAWGIFESSDTQGSDFRPLNGQSVQYTNYLYYTTPGGAGNYQTLTAYTNTVAPFPPSCITDSAGSGQATITFSGC